MGRDAVGAARPYPSDLAQSLVTLSVQYRKIAHGYLEIDRLSVGILPARPVTERPKDR